MNECLSVHAAGTTPGMTAEEADSEQEEPSARTVTLIKHRVATHGAEEHQEDAFRGCSLQSALAVDLLAAREVHNTRRFSFFALQPPCQAIQLVLVSTDGYACQGRLQAANEGTARLTRVDTHSGLPPALLSLLRLGVRVASTALFIRMAL
jgi:hypothetical protein